MTRLTILLTLLLPASLFADGTLVIAGGAVSPDNASVYRAFVDAIPDNGKVAIVSAASGSPVESAQRAADVLERYGVESSRIVPMRLAVRDDDSTSIVDESRWIDNGNSQAELDKLDGVRAVWFTGGDQSRLTRVLLLDGEDTAVLRRIRNIHADGGVLGGTSAGAAIMSDPMIRFGDTIATLLNDAALGEVAETTPGIGFFGHGMVDQHFDARARLGRLSVVLQQQRPADRIGFGIDEDSAMLVRGDVVRALGAGQVTVVDARAATWRLENAGYRIDDLRVSVLSPGDRWNLRRSKQTPASYLKRTNDNEYFKEKAPVAAGLAAPTGRVSTQLGENLLDNDSATAWSAPTLVEHGDSLRLIRYTFTQSKDSEGWWGYEPDGPSRYSLYNVELDIEAVSVSGAP